eukprot:scaffold300921_cov32-Prasinocladus_malaysianus.AAC.1
MTALAEAKHGVVHGSLCMKWEVAHLLCSRSAAILAARLSASALRLAAIWPANFAARSPSRTEALVT